MFDITSDDIALLNDEDLRTLVGLLCESELRARGFSAASVTWGGNQNAADGGLDVRVALQDSDIIDGFVPRPKTGFQVKKPDMSRTDILEEMRPNGTLRPAIRDLADRSGAYIIVCSAGSTSDSALQRRRDAMREAIQDLPNADDLALDFYDRGRIATWVRDHAGRVVWVRNKIGRSIPGWRPYGAWAYAPDGVGGEYLLDDTHRIRTDTETSESGFQPLEGIQRIRDRLRRAGKVVRLVGLSGVGKTRLVQALFDNRVGVESLDPSMAVYTDMADGPDPSPTVLASDLIASRTRAILVVDNCPPDLHRRLSEICRVPESRVSVITVEYDIREDQPEGTEVFELEPSSIDLIEKLAKRRFSHLSPVDLRTIAEFSGGNARIAIALAGTIDREETVAGMSDEDLFRRLFQQRHEPNESLLMVAQALSLVYSFQGEDVSDGVEAELFRLAAVVGKTGQEVFQSTAELRRRGLVQRRGVWRAVLPQAIANRLAARALQDIPASTIEACLVNGAPERLIRSFSRRLGYLDACPEATQIVRRWLANGGWLANVADFDDLGRTVFNNIAPVDPEASLSALERVLLESESETAAQKSGRYVPLLRSLAYDAALFERSTALLLKIAEAQRAENAEARTNDGDTNEASRAFASLFPIYFSGTHATLDQRLAVIQSLVRSDDSRKRALGLMALTAALETSHFGPRLSFEFGARSRDYGYWPRTSEAVKEWFRRTLQVTEMLACSDHSSAAQVRTVLADKFRGLWTGATMHDDLERVCRAIAKEIFWTEGWIAVRQTIFYDSKGFSPEVSARLLSLEALLQPRSLVQKVRSIILAESAFYVGVTLTSDGAGSIEKAMAQLEATAYDLGKAVASDNDAFVKLLPELIGGHSEQIWNFGRGLAEGTKEPRAIWNQLVAQLRITPEDKATPLMFRGFLNGLKGTDPKLVNDLLDDALENEVLARWYPVMQTAVGIDKEGLSRLIRSLELGKAWIGVYRNLEAGGVTHQLSGHDFNELLLKISDKPEGVGIAIEILSMRLSFARSQSTTSEIIEIGCELLRKLKLGQREEPSPAYRLEMIGRHCLIGEMGAATVREICSNLKSAVSKSETSVFYHRDLLRVLFSAQPVAALQSLCAGGAADIELGVRILDEAGQLQAHAFDAIPEPELLSWCDQQPETRYPVAAAGVTAFQPDQSGRPQWTATARKILDKSSNRIEVLKRFIRQFSSPGWDDVARAAAVESNLRLLDELAAYPDPALVEFVDKEKTRLSQAITAVRQIEPPIDRERDERFE
jgi:hypothetical protein